VAGATLNAKASITFRTVRGRARAERCIGESSTLH
jgi:hypothetical protein